MSEAEKGANAPEQPGHNAVANGNSAQTMEGASEGKAKRRRRGKRGKKAKGESAPAQNENGTRDGASAAGSDNSPARCEAFSNQKQSKRARRRRGRRRGQNTGAAQNNDTVKADASERSRRSLPQSEQPVSRRNRKSKNRQRESNAQSAVKVNKIRRPDAYAALDLGTNNCRLLVAVPQQPGRFRVVDAFSRIVRLGEGLGASGRLSDDAMDRAVGALKACADKLNNRDVRGVRLIATEACRRAANGAEFLERVSLEAGLNLEIIDRETEAHLAVAGCASLVDRKARGVVLFDIGGGSSELALIDLNKRKRHDLSPAIVSWTSLPLGVVTLSEKHGGGKLVTRPVFENMVAEVTEMLSSFEGRHALHQAADEGEIHLLGTSGTVTTLAGIQLNLPRYNRRLVDGTWMQSADVDTMIEGLVDMTFEERVANPCIGQDRADLVLAGCAILVAIQRMWPCPRLRVADRGLREGLLTQMMNADNAWQRRPRHFRHRNRARNNSNG